MNSSRDPVPLTGGWSFKRVWRREARGGASLTSPPGQSHIATYSLVPPLKSFFYWQAPCPYIFYYFFLYTVFVCKFRPQESQSDVLGDLHRMISLVVGSYFAMPPLLLPGLEPASPGTPTVLTRVRCLSLKPDMNREVLSHPDSRISAKVQSLELGLSRVLRPNDHQNHPELRHVSSLQFYLV